MSEFFVGNYQQMDGTPGVNLLDGAHVIVPGRGRTKDGLDLSAKSIDRLDHGADYYSDAGLADEDGLFVMSGYKTPAERKATLWQDPETGEEYVGVPEAISMDRRVLSREGSLSEKFGSTVPKQLRRVDLKSIDTVTNLAEIEAQGLFGRDERPVIIAAQEKHLERIVNKIAPKTLRRDYVGLVVPERLESDTDPRFARIASRLILGRANAVKQSPDEVLRRTTANAKKVWGGVLLVSDLVAKVKAQDELVYNSDK